MQEALVMMIGLLIASKMSVKMEESEKDSFTKEEIVAMLADACTDSMTDLFEDKK